MGRNTKDNQLLPPVTQDRLASTVSLVDCISAPLAQSISWNRTTCGVQTQRVKESKTANTCVLEQAPLQMIIINPPTSTPLQLLKVNVWSRDHNNSASHLDFIAAGIGRYTVIVP